MDVIESLKHKTEENNEEIGAGGDSSEKSDVPADDETEVGSENPDMPDSIDKDAETEAGSENPEMPESSDKDGGEIPATDGKTEATCKRKTRNEDASSMTHVEKKGKKSNESNEVEVVRDDSPSSPLHVETEEDDNFR